MHHLVYCTAKHGVHTILCTMTHRIESAIPTPCDIFYCLKVADQLCLVGLSKLKDNRKQEFGLVDKECAHAVHCQPHVSTHQ